MNLTQAFQSVDLDKIIDRLTAFAYGRLKSVGIKNFEGKEPVDFVGDVLCKILEGTRDWSKAECTFEMFLFGCLKSEIDSFFRTKKYIHDGEFPNAQSDQRESDVHNKRQQVVGMLKQEGADDVEVLLFQYWADGINKPSYIAKDLRLDIKEIYKAIKRLERRLPKIHSLINVEL